MDSARVYHNLALIGFMGTGKTSVGHLIAPLLHFQLVDTDELIERSMGKSISRIFAEEGEARFREHERAVVAELAQLRNAVISAGGGLAAIEANMASLKSHALVVCLWASAEAIWHRVMHQTHRPLLQEADPLGKIRRLLCEREGVYRQADVLINTEMRSVKEVAHQVMFQFRAARERFSV